MPVSLLALGVAFAITAAAATVQGTIGIGLAVVSVPLLALIDPVLVPVPQLLISFALTIPMAMRERTAIDASGVGWIVAGRIPGALIGLLILAQVSGNTIELAIGLVVLVAVGLIAAGLAIPRNPTTSFGVGVVSGITSLLASIGGPPIALLYSEAEGAVIRSTLSTVFTLGIAITVVTRVVAGEITSDDLIIAGFLAPAVLLGLRLSGPMRGRVEGAALRSGVLIVSGTAAATLILRTLVR